ncbi:MAG: hypothetical protein IT270_14555 [Saprospiraceae bacterium]|nr:hypothetical protein [Saprospiraceae bacterium]
MSWLTGAMSDIPIQFPKTFDLKGIINLILQVMGLTWPQIRLVLVERLGEKTVAAAEETVDIVKRVITEGPMALWEMIKEKAEEIKEHVMEGVRNWAALELVKQGIIKLLSMLNPVGAIVQAILAIYNTVMFFVENWQRIVDFVGSIFSSIGNIAKGAISAAAAAIERALALTIPIILGFLARFIGLSGVGKAVKNIIMKLRKPIDKVVHKMADMVGKLVKKVVGKGKALAKKGKEKVKAGVEKVLAWWKMRKKFKGDDDKSHELYFKGTANNATMMVASNPMTVDKFLEKVKAQIDEMEGDKNSEKDKAKSQFKIASDLDKDINKLETDLEKANLGTATDKKVQANQAKYDKLKGKVDALSEALASLMNLSGYKGKMPPPILPPFSNNVRAGNIKAQYLSSTNNVPKGEASKDHDGNLGAWFELINENTRKRDNFVRMHILHHNMGGKATDSNLTPAKSVVNTDFYNRLEKPALTDSGLLTGKKKGAKPIWYKVDVTYHEGDDFSKNFINSIKASYGFHEESENWKEMSAEKSWSATPGVPDHGEKNKYYVINEDGSKVLNDMKYKDKTFSDKFVQFLLNERNKSLETGSRLNFGNDSELSDRLNNRIIIENRSKTFADYTTRLVKAINDPNSNIMLHGKD